MKIHAGKLGQAVAIGFSIVWLLCSFAVWLAPGPMMQLTATMMHLDAGEMTWSVTPVGVVVGMVGWAALSGGLAWLCVTLYNRLV